FPDGKTRGWLDAKSNAVKTTDDGATGGDGLGGARVIGAGYASVIAPHIELGTAEGLGANQGVATKADLQAAVTAVIAHAQTALNGVGAIVQGGSGVGPPTIAAVTATGSATVKVTD